MTYSHYSKTNLLFEYLELLNCFLLRSYLWLLCVYYCWGKGLVLLCSCVEVRWRLSDAISFLLPAGSGDSNSDLQAFAANEFTQCHLAGPKYFQTTPLYVVLIKHSIDIVILTFLLLLIEKFIVAVFFSNRRIVACFYSISLHHFKLLAFENACP